MFNCRKMLNFRCELISKIRTTNNHFISIGNRNYATRKRFYKKTGILYNDGKYEIILDQRKLKTPKGNLLTIDSEPLALAVATEWDAQKPNIQQSTMHLSTLCNTVIDNPNNLTKYDLIRYVTNYLNTDTILYQSDVNDDLYKLQVQEWDPIVEWFCRRFDITLDKCRNMDTLETSDKTKAVISKHFMSYNFNGVNGYVYGIDTLKSVILTVACAERFINTEKAVSLSRLEEEFQVGKWGRVEWAHDLSRQDLQARIAATMLFVHFNSSSWSTQTKT